MIFVSICIVHHIVTEYIFIRSWQDYGLNHTAENRLHVQGKSRPTHAGCCAPLQPPHFGLAILGENDKEELLGFLLGGYVQMIPGLKY